MIGLGSDKNIGSIEGTVSFQVTTAQKQRSGGVLIKRKSEGTENQKTKVDFT